MDLIRFIVAKRLEFAEQIDRKEVTEDQARTGIHEDYDSRYHCCAGARLRCSLTN